MQVARFEVVPEYLVILYEDSAINRPNTEKLIHFKKEFFESVRDVYSTYRQAEKKRIRNAHCYEIAFCAIKEKKFLKALWYVVRCGLNVSSIKDLMKRYGERKC